MQGVFVNLNGIRMNWNVILWQTNVVFLSILFAYVHLLVNRIRVESFDVYALHRMC